MTKKYGIYAALLIVLFLLHTAAVKVFQGASFVPDLLLLFIVLFATTRSLPESLWFAFGGGFLWELFSAEFFGAQIFALLVCSIAAYLVTRNLTAQQLGVPTAVFLVIGTTILRLLAVFVYQLVAASLDLASVIPAGVFLNAGLVSLLIANLLAFYLLHLIFRHLPQ